jgi:hypothetical protein
MMGVRTPETWWAVHKRQVMNLRNCCIWLVDLLELYSCCWAFKASISWVFSCVMCSVICHYKLETWNTKHTYTFNTVQILCNLLTTQYLFQLTAHIIRYLESRSTPIPHLHDHLQVIPIHHYIYQLTERFSMRCSMHTNPLIQNIGNYTTKDLHCKNTKYIHKHIKHILL